MIIDTQSLTRAPSTPMAGVSISLFPAKSADTAKNRRKAALVAGGCLIVTGVFMMKVLHD